MAKAKEIDEETIKALKENLRYDPETGLFWWTKPKSGRTLNKPAGTLRGDGYVIVQFRGENYLAHRLAFILMGEPLPEVVDHIDGDPSNNKWANLRVSCHQTNTYNKSKQRNKAVGYKGVVKEGVKFRARITCGGSLKHLGSFDCPKEAHKAYCDAADKIHKEYKNYG